MAQKDSREEIAYLRQTFRSLDMRGDYRKCLRLIEENLKLLYFQERWPENFLASLAVHRKCYPSIENNTPYFDYLSALLEKAGIPPILSKILKGGGKINWSGESLRGLTLDAQQEGNHTDALGYAELMVKVDPLSSSGYLLKGWVLRELGRGAQAAESLERAIELNKTNFQARSALAEIYALTQPEKAIAFIDDSIAASPNVAELWAAKARILLASGDKDGAIAGYEHANTLDPINIEYIYARAEVLRQTPGQEIAALMQYNQVLVINEGHLPTHTRLAFLLEQSQPEAALTHATKIFDANPQSLEFCLLKARLTQRCGNSQAAIRQYKTALEIDPTSAQAYGALGKLYLPEGADRALPYYQKALEYAPGQPDYLVGKGDCHRALGENSAAVESYKSAIAGDKTAHKAYYALGSLLAESDPKAAVGYFTKASGLAPEQSRYYQAKGELLLNMPDMLAQTLECFDKAVKYDPGNGHLRNTLGKLLVAGGKPASAIEHYKTAVSLEPGLEEAFGALGRLLWENEPENALIYLNSAIYLDPNKAEYYHLKSLCYVQLGEKPDVVRKLRSNIAEDKRNLNAYQELSQLLDGDTHRVAMMYINRAIEIIPGNATYLCVRANLFEAMGDAKNATAQYRQVSESDPSFDAAWFGLGRLSSRSGEDDKAAIGFIDKAIALAPDKAEYFQLKAEILGRNPESYAEALSCFEEARNRNKEWTAPVIGKARLYRQRGETFDAIDHFRRALLLDSNCLEATATLGVMLTDIAPAAGLVYLAKAIELEPENYIHYVWQARAYYNRDDEENASTAIEKAIELGSGGELAQGDYMNAQLYFNLAKVLYQRLPEASLRYCILAVESEPENPDYHLLLGNIHRKAGNMWEAKESFERAIELNPSCHEALARLAEMLYGQGQRQSLELIDRALEVNGGNASYHYIRGLILGEVFADHADSIQSCLAAVRTAVSLNPTNLTYREKLVELLAKSGAGWQHFLEKRVCAKLRKRIEKAHREYAGLSVGS